MPYFWKRTLEQPADLVPHPAQFCRRCNALARTTWDPMDKLLSNFEHVRLPSWLSLTHESPREKDAEGLLAALENLRVIQSTAHLALPADCRLVLTNHDGCKNRLFIPQSFPQGCFNWYWHWHSFQAAPYGKSLGGRRLRRVRTTLKLGDVLYISDKLGHGAILRASTFSNASSESASAKKTPPSMRQRPRVCRQSTRSGPPRSSAPRTREPLRDLNVWTLVISPRHMAAAVPFISPSILLDRIEWKDEPMGGSSGCVFQ